MRVAIVYESMFGNTHVVAAAVADGIRDADPDGQVTVLHVSDAAPATIGGTDLLVVGGPTHMRGMTTELTRRKGLEEAASVRGWGDARPTEETAAGPGVREWLERMPLARRGSLGAAFDTRDGYRLAGGAARAIARWLQFNGYDMVAPPQGFIVWGTEGPRRRGERAKARAWGTRVARSAHVWRGDDRTNDSARGRPSAAAWKQG